MSVHSNCPVMKKDAKGKRGKCPYFNKIFGKCFTYCDVESPRKCGDCAHWLGNCTAREGVRHSICGSCRHVIGIVNAHFHTNCPHYIKRKPGEPWYVDWVEARVLELGGKPDSSPESRAIRRQALREWDAIHEVK